MTPNHLSPAYDSREKVAAAAWAYRGGRFLVGGVVVYGFAYLMGSIVDRYSPGASTYVVGAVMGVYVVSALINLSVAAVTWPKSEDSLYLKLIVPDESENAWDPRESQFWHLYRTRALLNPQNVTIEVRGQRIRPVRHIVFVFSDGNSWTVVPGRHEFTPPFLGKEGVLAFELAPTTLSLKSLRHGAIVRGIVEDTSGGHRRARVSVERAKIPPRRTARG